MASILLLTGHMETFVPRRHVLGCICLNCLPETRDEDMYAALFGRDDVLAEVGEAIDDMYGPDWDGGAE